MKKKRKTQNQNERTRKRRRNLHCPSSSGIVGGVKRNRFDKDKKGADRLERGDKSHEEDREEDGGGGRGGNFGGGGRGAGKCLPRLFLNQLHLSQKTPGERKRDRLLIEDGGRPCLSF